MEHHDAASPETQAARNPKQPAFKRSRPSKDSEMNTCQHSFDC